MAATGKRRGGWLDDGLLRRLFGNASWLLGGKALNAVFSLAYLALAARTLGVELFGVLVLIHTYTQVAGDLAKFQSWQAVLRYGAALVERRRTGAFQRLLGFTITLDLISAAAGVALAVGAAPFAGRLLGWPAEIMPAAILYSASIPFMVTGTPTGVLRLLDRFGLLALQSSLGSLARLLGAGVLFVLGGGLHGFLLVWFLATMLSGLTLIAAAWRALRERGLLDGVRPSWRGLAAPHDGIWKFVWITNLNATLILGSTHAGTLLVGWLLGPADAALFRIARQFAEAIAKPAKLLTPAIYPELARLSAQRELARMRDLVIRSAVVAGLGATAVMALLALAGRWILHLVVGPDFAGAYEVMVLLGLAAMVGIWAFSLEPVLISVGRAATALAIRATATLAYLALSVWLLTELGLIGAGLAAVIAALMSLCGLSVPVMRRLRRPADSAPPA